MTHYENWYHDNAKGRDVHIDYVWVYRNAADREAGENEVNGLDAPITRDVGKLALQLDTRTVWRLWSVDPLDWGPENSQRVISEDVEYFIDPTIGNDDNDGLTVETPFLTLNRALSVVDGAIIEAEFRVTILGPSDFTELNEFYRVDFHGEGRIVVDASGVDPVVVAGPFTVDTVAGVGGVTTNGVATATDLTITPDPSWAVNEHWGNFILMTSGNWEGYRIPIIENGSDFVRVAPDWFGWAPGDTFEIVREPVNVILDHELKLLNAPTNSVRATVQGFNFAGIRFIKTAGITGRVIELENTGATFSFCTIIPETEGGALFLDRTSLNFEAVPAGTFSGGPTFEDYFQLGFQIIPPQISDEFILVIMRSSYISSAYLSGEISLSDEEAIVYYSQLKGINFWNQANLWTDHLYIDRVPGSWKAGIAGSQGLSFLNNVYVHNAVGVYKNYQNGFCHCLWVEAGDIGTHDFILTNATVVQIGSDVASSGTVAAIRFNVDNSDHGLPENPGDVEAPDNDDGCRVTWPLTEW